MRHYLVNHGEVEVTEKVLLSAVSSAVPTFKGLRNLGNYKAYSREYNLLCWIFLSPTPPSVYKVWPQLGELMTCDLKEQAAIVVSQDKTMLHKLGKSEGPNGLMVVGKIRPFCMSQDYVAAWLLRLPKDVVPALFRMECGCFVFEEWAHAPVESLKLCMFSHERECSHVAFSNKAS